MTDAADGRVALVTGAGSGIGAAVASALLARGDRVVLAGRHPDTLERTARDAGGDALVARADVTDPESVDALFGAVADRWGRLDLLFNNAGVFGAPAGIADVPFEAWRTVLDTNVTGAFLCAQAAFRMMRDQDPQGGRIINNGSVSAHTPRPLSVAYTASKHAVTGLTKSLSLEGRAFGIACGQIDIGNAATDMTTTFTGGVLQADGSVRSEPVMDVRNAVEAVLFMADLPAEANVQFMSVLATTMPSFVGRG
ncbi:SDR family oxidoreductase [Actinomadura rupiterrae]|uniref:SDR family oxidoreductase n=1 Tax=Actinomadura rupiterrae TaxID=559627 RepID=UPI0020A4AD38|nr:SDR family oxidoreductase [Actinomadura rupiterrae]MCP2343103.1 NAD(P)-dependent dehydrogenase (short-subunit alcohol dehydrogenase family) [Actinomadura rupiterrae]